MNKILTTGMFMACLLTSAQIHAASKYEYCMRDATKVGDNAIAECMQEETKRIDALIYKEYEAITADPYFKEWHNGSGMFRGRVKTLYETWYKYREEFCSLFTLSMKNYLGTEKYNTQRCLLDFAQNHYNYIKGIILNKNSTPE